MFREDLLQDIEDRCVMDHDTLVIPIVYTRLIEVETSPVDRHEGLVIFVSQNDALWERQGSFTYHIGTNLIHDPLVPLVRLLPNFK